MEENLYKTPESDVQVEPSSFDINDVQYAGFWVRFAATIIDTILFVLITLPALSFYYGPDYWFAESMVLGMFDVVMNYVFPAVVVFLFWYYKSATPGKMMLGLKVISLGDRQELSVGQIIGRYFGYYLSSLILCVGFIMVAFSDRKQGLHDRLANTTVVKTR
jgi:uncharacterized RDD family membrane protein YckC